MMELFGLISGLAALVWLLGGRKQVARWGSTLWDALAMAWLSRWVPCAVRLKVTGLAWGHNRAFRKGVGYRRFDAAQDFFHIGARALRRYILDHEAVLKTTTRERHAPGLWEPVGPYEGVWDHDPWGSPFITNADAFLRHVEKVRKYDIVDSWHLAALDRWWRCRQKITTTWKAARRRRHVPRGEHEARRIRRIHWFAWPIALPAMAWILWHLTQRP